MEEAKNEIISFECQITTKTGEKKHFQINLPSIIQKGGKVIYKDENSNIFEYDSISYDNIIYNPDIDFDIFHYKEDKFLDRFRKAYLLVLTQIVTLMGVKGTGKLLIQLSKDYKTKELFKKHIKDLNISHKFYYEDFDKIYFENNQKMIDIKPEELNFIKSNGYRKITRYSAFLILLYRHKDNEDFLLKGDFDIKNEDSLKNLFEKFYNAYKQDKIYLTKKEVKPIT